MYSLHNNEQIQNINWEFEKVIATKKKFNITYTLFSKLIHNIQIVESVFILVLYIFSNQF